MTLSAQGLSLANRLTTVTATLGPGEVTAGKLLAERP